jgi:hypothetical protein
VRPVFLFLLNIDDPGAAEGARTHALLPRCRGEDLEGRPISGFVRSAGSFLKSLPLLLADGFCHVCRAFSQVFLEMDMTNRELAFRDDRPAPSKVSASASHTEQVLACEINLCEACFFSPFRSTVAYFEQLEHQQCAARYFG